MLSPVRIVDVESGGFGERATERGAYATLLVVVDDGLWVKPQEQVKRAKSDSRFTGYFIGL